MRKQILSQMNANLQPEDEEKKVWRRNPDGSRTDLVCRIHLKSEIFWIAYTERPPKPVRKAISNGQTVYRWGESFIYCVYGTEARRLREQLKEVS